LFLVECVFVDVLLQPCIVQLSLVSHVLPNEDTIMQCAFPILVVAISYPLIGLNGESADRVLIFYFIMAVPWPK